MNTESQDDQQLGLPHLDVPLGLRLRHAREARGWSVADVAEKLRLKAATVEAIEREQIDDLGAAVYVRGYFNSYARLVGVPVVLVESLFARHSAPPPELKTTARISHSRYLFDRYARRAVYVVLTASIVVPVVLLATRNQLPQQAATLTPLDAPLSEPATPAATDGAPAADAAAAPAVVPRSAGETPVIASLGPFYGLGDDVPEPQPPQDVAAAAAPPAGDDAGLSFHLTGDSWVEVVDHQGRRLEHGLLRAGTRRQFAPGQVARVALGNAGAVEVRMNGEPTDIAAFQRANVARFTVSSDGSLAPAGG